MQRPTPATAFKLMLAALARYLDRPSDLLPSVRCISLRTLRELIGGIRAHDENAQLRRYSIQSWVGQLEAAAVISALALDNVDQHLDQLFAVGLGTDPDSLEPADLLMALEPKGVACYFSALAIHRLTTQFPAHHHVARLIWRSPRAGPAYPVAPRLSSASSTHRKLGTLRVAWGGLPYYSTQRDLSLVTGVAVHHLSDRLQCRVTTLEQTLLDTLLRPASCGGPPRVFEAWEVARSSTSVETMIDLLGRIDHPELWRRAGFMMENQDYDIPESVLATLRHRTMIARGEAPVPLLPGMPYTRAEPRWRLLVP